MSNKLTQRPSRFEVLTMADIERLAEERPVCIWDGYLAQHKITLLVGTAKLGKSTLATLLLARMSAGGLLAGSPVHLGRAVVISEEPSVHWLTRRQRHGLGPNVMIMSRSFRTRPTMVDWASLVDELLSLHRTAAIDLLIVDTLASFMPCCESSSGDIRDFIDLLRRLANAGPAVLLIHHACKGASAPGTLARGSQALLEATDIYLEFTAPRQARATDRRRLLRVFSRLDETPPERLIELNADGTDYQVLGDASDFTAEAGCQTLFAVLAAAEARLTLREILARWPAGRLRPPEASLYRWLARAVADGLVTHAGHGHRHDPLRYGLAGRAT